MGQTVSWHVWEMVCCSIPFANKLSEKLGVTVGIIGCNWGGTSASCWISREFLGQDNRIASYLKEYDEIIENQDFEEYLKEMEEYTIYQAEFDKNVSNYYATSPNPTWEEATSLLEKTDILVL